MPSENLQIATLENLAECRRLLQEFCGLHVESLWRFHKHLSFKVLASELDEQISKDGIHHLTSTATCYASIIEDCPKTLWTTKSYELLDTTGKAAEASMARTDWTSDGSAPIYCRCRALPFFISKLDKWREEVAVHVRVIFKQLSEEEEKTKESGRDVREAIGEEDYPPNAYQTFWALETLDAIKVRFSDQFQKLDSELGLGALRDGMHRWAQMRLTREISLHSAMSSVLDSDQLAWSLAIFLRDTDPYQSSLAEQDLVRQAFRCLFTTQQEIGTWRHYVPLFHYEKAGNAYCYVFETFAWLLKQTLRPKADFTRTLLKDHFGNLIQLWKYAIKTQTVIEQDKQLAWSSGHRTNQPYPESWATASVFTYAQALRRLVGIWAREEALKSLGCRKAAVSRDKARKDLNALSKSWSKTGSDITTLLYSMFINSAPEVASDADLEPDSQPIGEKSPRAAILFGPPGTGKTSLVRAIAATVGWNYVELHPGHFVAEGLPKVQYTADVIFRTLMELDHTVVLFDEVDELVRERDIEPDQFGRFLTTSMLPRLAELWKARKIMYFVATNHIEYFDRAVTRSERFDAILYIGPPSFEVKQQQLLGILEKRHGIQTQFDPELTKEKIEAAIPMKNCDEIDKATNKELPDSLKAVSLTDEFVLSKFALLRWDELDELAEELATALGNSTSINSEVLAKALGEIRDTKSRTIGEYHRFISDFKYERYDVSKIATWLVEIEGFDAAGNPPAPIEKQGKRFILKQHVGLKPNIQISGYQMQESPEGKVKLTKQALQIG